MVSVFGDADLRAAMGLAGVKKELRSLDELEKDEAIVIGDVKSLEENKDMVKELEEKGVLFIRIDMEAYKG